MDLRCVESFCDNCSKRSREDGAATYAKDANDDNDYNENGHNGYGNDCSSADSLFQFLSF